MDLELATRASCLPAIYRSESPQLVLARHAAGNDPLMMVIISLGGRGRLRVSVGKARGIAFVW